MARIGSKDTDKKTNVYSIRRPKIKKNLERILLYLSSVVSVVALLKSFGII